MTNTLDPTEIAVQARRAAAESRLTLTRLNQSLAALEARAVAVSDPKRRHLLARCVVCIIDAWKTREASRRLPMTATSTPFLRAIELELTGVMSSAKAALDKLSDNAYRGYSPLDAALLVAQDMRDMMAKPKAKTTPAVKARTAFDELRRGVAVRSDEEEAAANEQTCPTCGQKLPADTDEEDAENNIGGPSRSSHRHWTTHNIGVIARKSADGKPMVRIAASSNAVDLEEDQFQLSALREMRDQFGGKLIFLNHKYAVPVDVFGTVEKTALRERGGLTFLDLDVKVATDNPLAVTAYNMIASGTRLGVSVGVLIREAERRKDDKGNVINGLAILHVIGLEASIVGIPANQTAWTTGAKRLRGAALREAREMMALR